MGQQDHNMTEEEESEDSDGSTVTYKVVRFTDLIHDSDTDEVD